MIQGERVRQARELRGLTQVQLAAALEVDQSAIAHMENGRQQPSTQLAERLSATLAFPSEFFEQAPPPAFPLGSLLFRSLRSTSSRERTQARRYGELVHELAAMMSARVRVLNEPKIPRRLAEMSSISPRQAAQVTRDALGVSPDAPIPHLSYLLERTAGVLITALPIRLASQDAFSLWIGETQSRPLIVVSGELPGDRLRFSLAHELGHLTLHDSHNFVPASVEREAHEFAGEFLMPAEGIVEEFPRPITLQRLAALKPRWGVSIQALILRAKDLDVISDRHARRLFQRLSAMGWRAKEPMGIEPEKPRAVRRMAELLYGTPPNFALMSQLTNHIPVGLLGSIIESHASAEELPARRREMTPHKIVPMATLALRHAPTRDGLARRPRRPAS